MNDSSRPVLGMVLKGYPRISETFISNEILNLERLGFSVHLFSMRDPREKFCHASVRQIKARADYLPQTITGNVRLLLRHNAALALKQPGRYAAALLTAARRFLRTRKSATIKHLLQAGYLVNGLAGRAGITHFHAHFAHSPTSVAMFASILSGRKFSFTAHAKDIYTSDPRQLKEKIAMARFVVTCTEYNRQYLLNLADGSGNGVHRVYHGIDTALFNGRTGNFRPETPFSILTVARLTAKKGLPTVLEALAGLARDGVDFRYTLIGDGDDRDGILGMIRNLGLEDRTCWLGTLPHEEVLEHYRQADLFVLGCRIVENGDRDGIPNVLLESMAMGVPVVVTRVSAIPELVEHEATGLLVTPENPGEMAGAMQRLLTDAELRRRIIPQARGKVMSEFDNRKLIDDLAALFGQAGFSSLVKNG